MPDTIPLHTPLTLDSIAESMVVTSKAAEEVRSSDDAAGPAPTNDSLSGSQDVEQDEIQEEVDAERNTPNTEDFDQDDQDDQADEGETDGDDAQSDPEDDEDVLDNIFDADQEGADEVASTDGLDTSTLGEDVMFSVTEDGVETQVPLGELKQRYAGEGAIDKRLQEATEHRNLQIRDYEQSKQLTDTVMQQFGQALFRRTVPEPSVELLRTNQAEYHIQKTLYDQESNALVGEHQKLSNLMGQLDQANTQATQQRRAAASVELRRVMPVFNDPVKGPKVREVLVQAAMEIGFTREAISQCEDPLIFKAVALAARELRRQSGAKVTKVTPKPRTLQSGGTRNKPASTISQRNERDTIAKAKASGSVDDVAQTMIVKQPRKRGRR
jgi:hypothetical protein